MSLNSKFDLVRSHIPGQRLIPSLMEVCFEVRLEEDHTNPMNIVTILVLTLQPLVQNPHVLKVKQNDKPV